MPPHEIQSLCVSFGTGRQCMLVTVRMERCERLTTLIRKPCGDPFWPLMEGLKFPLPVNARISCCRVAIHPSGF